MPVTVVPPLGTAKLAAAKVLARLENSTFLKCMRRESDALTLVYWAVFKLTHDEAIPMFLTCPMCNTRHIDEGIFATKLHHTHTCQNPTCGLNWRPCVEYTVGVYHLPNFKNK